jgi:ABC-type nitrate/sulfonate/bicarbonate transport system permease component
MLRQIIFSVASGGVIGVAIASLVLYSSWLTQATVRFLRIGLWLPFLIIFAVPATFSLSITAVTLCNCYHYLAARSLLRLERYEALTYSLREGVLQGLFISLISQIWLQRWLWFGFWAPVMKPPAGFGVLTVVMVLIAFVNWIFRSSLEVTAKTRATIQTKELDKPERRSFLGVGLIAFGCFVIWHLFSALRFNFLRSSPREALNAAYYLFVSGEIWNDIAVSLLEIVGGMILGGSVGLAVFAFFSFTPNFRKVLFPLIPMTYISPIVLWLEAFLFWSMWFEPNWQGSVQGFIYVWHKVIAVGCLTFFPLFQALWGLRNHPWAVRIVLAVDDALPIAFVTMLFGELMAATAGLGFMMTIASAMHQTDKGLAGFLITLALLVGLSATLRLVAKNLCVSVEGRAILSA